MMGTRLTACRGLHTHTLARATDCGGSRICRSHRSPFPGRWSSSTTAAGRTGPFLSCTGNNYSSKIASGKRVFSTTYANAKDTNIHALKQQLINDRLSEQRQDEKEAWDQTLRARPSGLRLLDKKRSKADRASKPNQKQPKGARTAEGNGDRRKEKHDVREAQQGLVLGQSPSLPIRARFAPSPTGYVHLGSLRTAVLNKMAAIASTGGSFVLRIEDTDRSRYVEDAEQRLISDLKWAGLEWDEGPDCGGPHGPYRQSERLEIYQEQVQTLLDKGHAYRCFCSQEQLDAQKQSLHEAGQSTAYPKTCRSVPAEESDSRAAAGEPHMLRFKGDAFGRPKFRDTTFGLFQKGEDEEDFVLLKTDGYPTYHLANVVDDHLMEITDVIRGEEWLVSTPKHIALYDAFGWAPPRFSHLALLVNPDGTKLSKRQNSAGIADHRETGVAPMALLNWLVSLGAGTPTNVAFMKNPPRSVEELAEKMIWNSLKRVPISVPLGQLQVYRLQYAKHLAKQLVVKKMDHPEPLKPSETAVMEDFCRPLLRRAIELLPANSPNPTIWPDALFKDERRLAMALQDLDPSGERESVATPLHHLLYFSKSSSVDPDELLKPYPYLVWQVPDSLYKYSLARYAGEEATRRDIDLETLEALTAYIRDESNPPESWHDQLSKKDDMQRKYDTLRLVATGQYEQPSPPAGQLFSAISREDWLQRVLKVRALWEEMGDGMERRREWAGLGSSHDAEQLQNAEERSSEER